MHSDLRKLAVVVFLAGSAIAQQPAPQQPKVQVNVLNVCAPPPADQEQLAKALAAIPERPSFGADFEVSRGRSTLSKSEMAVAGKAESDVSAVSRWVRIRRESPEKSPIQNAQYSLSVGDEEASETLVLRMRDPRDVMLVTFSDSVPSASAAQLAQTNTPPARIRVERFGKSSIVLARCPGDQSAYEPLFTKSRQIFEQYRAAMGVRTTVPAELARLPKTKGKSAAKGGDESNPPSVNH